MTQIAQEIPKVGLVMEEVKVVRWLKNVGDSVIAGEPLLEVETEKSVVEIEAAATGRLIEILVQVDGRAVVGDQVAWIESAQAQPAAATTSAPRAADRSAERIRSTPVARRLAAERGIDLDGLVGTGPGGRVQLHDVQRASAAPRAAGVGPQSLSPMRRAVARAMSLSSSSIPQFNVARLVDWTELQDWRRELAAKLPDGLPRLSANDFLLQAVARSLMEFPAMNATFAGDPDSAGAHLVQASGAHIGLVVAVADGLLVPVIHDVEQMSLVEIARRREDCVERALKGRLKREEVDGATFSISNLGADGPDRFTAIINPPQSAILAVGRRRDCVVAREAGIVVCPLSDLTLTVDHRVADGRLAAQFLARLIEILERRDWRLQ
ncbi:MAG: dihydrolipoamide acetyltransferase family protein [Steroidobacteraceae bacterium]